MCLGIPGQIVEVTDRRRKLALVNVAGVKRVINVACIARDDGELQDCVGAWVLVHVGFAMARIDAAEAQKTLDLLTALGEAQAEVAALSQPIANGNTFGSGISDGDTSSGGEPS
jgi:hydrogenase expression/formation protein HypC